MESQTPDNNPPSDLLSSLDPAEFLSAVSAEDDPTLYLSRRLAELDDAIQMSRSTQELYGSSQLTALGVLLLERYRINGEEASLTEAISLSRTALEHATTHDLERADALDALGDAIGDQYVLTGQDELLSEKIALHQVALDIRTRRGGDQFLSLCGLGIAKLALFRMTDEESELSTASDLLTRAGSLRPESAKGHSVLAEIYTAILYRNGQSRDFDLALSHSFTAVRHSTPGTPGYCEALSSLSRVLWHAYTHDMHIPGNIDLLLRLLRTASTMVIVDRPHPGHCIVLEKFAMALQAKFRMYGDTCALNEAISLVCHAISLINTSHKCHIFFTCLLTTLLQDLFVTSTNLAHLDESILLLRQVTASSSHPHALIHKLCLSQLSLALHVRFDFLADLRDVEEALDIALALERDISDGHPNKVSGLSMLAVCYVARYEYSKDRSDLAMAMEWHRRVADHPKLEQAYDCGILLGLIGSTLALSAQETRDVLQLQEAIAYKRKGLARLPYLHPSDASLTILAEHLRMLYEWTHDLSLLDEALKLHRDYLDILTPDEPQHAFLMRGFGLTLAAKYNVTSERCLLNDAMSAFAKATAHAYSPLTERYDAAISWAVVASDAGEHVHAERAYTTGLGLLPRIAYLTLNAGARIKGLRQAPTLTMNAAMHALAYATAERALEFLEQGRAIFWTLALNLRTPLDDVPHALSTSLRAVSEQLQLLSHAGVEDAVATEGKAIMHRKLSAEFDDIVGQVRALPEFSDFMRPLTFSALSAAAQGGYIVVVLGDDAGSRAIIVQPDCADSVDLGIRSSELQKIQESLKEGLARGQEGELDTRLKLSKKTAKGQSNLEDILRKLWTGIVKPIISKIGLQKSMGKSRPRLWWCGVGAFMSLPLHAAGDSSDGWLSDYAVSSYTPTVTHLLRSRRQLESQPANVISRRKAILAAQSHAERLPALPGTALEVDFVRDTIKEHCSERFDILEISGAQVLASDVLKDLADASILHLACHGQQDRDPLKSCFHIGPGGERITVADLMKLEIPGASFAFLGACESAMGDSIQRDESLHLAAALLFAGFPSVVGTMWSMSDSDGPVVAPEVYRELLADGVCNLDAVPYAVDAAVNKLRESGVSALRWATYIHMGA